MKQATSCNAVRRHVPVSGCYPFSYLTSRGGSILVLWKDSKHNRSLSFRFIVRQPQLVFESSTQTLLATLCFKSSLEDITHDLTQLRYKWWPGTRTD